MGNDLFTIYVRKENGKSFYCIYNPLNDTYFDPKSMNWVPSFATFCWRKSLPNLLARLVRAGFLSRNFNFYNTTQYE